VSSWSLVRHGCWKGSLHRAGCPVLTSDDKTAVVIVALLSGGEREAKRLPLRLL
jgi:hypothetical protein